MVVVVDIVVIRWWSRVFEPEIDHRSATSPSNVIRSHNPFHRFLSNRGRSSSARNDALGLFHKDVPFHSTLVAPTVLHLSPLIVLFDPETHQSL